MIIVKRSVKVNKRAVNGAKPATHSSQKGLLPSIRRINDRSAVVIFLVFLVVVLFLFDSVLDQKVPDSGVMDSIEQELVSESVANELISELKVGSPVGFIVKDTVDPQLLDHFTSMDYNQIKAELGVESDFVIHFEDESGHAIQLGNKWCTGSDNTMVNGIPCS